MASIGAEVWQALFRDYFVVLCALILFGVLLFSHRVLPDWVQKCFTLAWCSIALLVVGEYFERALSTLPEPTLARRLLSALNYSTKTLIVFSVTQISGRSWKSFWKTWNVIPACFNCLVCFLSVWTKWVFQYNNMNCFGGGPLRAVPFLTACFYFVELIYMTFRHMQKKEAQEGIICVGTTVLCVASAWIEMRTELEGLLPNAAMASLIFYYAYFLLSRYSHDFLTDTLLRTRFFADLERIHKSTCVMTFDLNGLKHINDEKGHDAGDRALSEFADAVSMNLPSGAAFYRIGGDEFAVLYRNGKPAGAEAFLVSVRDSLKKSGLTFAAGYAFLSDGRDGSKSLKEADEMMYEDKRRFYRQAARIPDGLV